MRLTVWSSKFIFPLFEMAIGSTFVDFADNRIVCLLI
jgi:hypothetical protein